MRDTIREGARGATVRELQTLLNSIYADPLFVDGIFGPATEACVRDFQHNAVSLTGQKLVVDGVVGPRTWTALDIGVRKTARRVSQQAAATDADLSALGTLTMIDAHDVWAEDIFDPKSSDRSADAARCRAVIDDCIRGDQGLSWSWEDAYKGDGDFEWCGAFAARCWRGLKERVRRLYFASTYRLDRYGSYRPVDHEANTGAGRLYAQLDEHSTSLPFEPRAGDLLLIGPKGYGQHICLIDWYDHERREFHTIEGNGTGEGPHGEHQHGVVKGVRPLGAERTGMWCARRLIRPSVEDLA